MGKSIFKILPPPFLLMLLPTLWDFNGVTVCVGFSKVFLSFDRKIAVNGEIAGLILQ